MPPPLPLPASLFVCSIQETDDRDGEQSMMQYNMRVGASAAIIKEGSILLVAFSDASSGFHYNVPGAGVEPGETIHEALKRELWEEACADIEIGRLLLVTKYEPRHNADRYGALHKLGLIFVCQLKAGSKPQLPKKPDPNQVGIDWIRLEELGGAPLLPTIAGLFLPPFQND